MARIRSKGRLRYTFGFLITLNLCCDVEAAEDTRGDESTIGGRSPSIAGERYYDGGERIVEVAAEGEILKEELDGLATNYPDRFKIYYVLNQPPEVWNGGVGFVSKEMIETHCPAPAHDIKILRCGPPPMNKAMAAHLEALGYAPEMQFQF